MKAVYGYGDSPDQKLKQREVSGFLKKIVGSGPKYSFIQRNLLSKPQDSVGRATIIVDPDLGLDEIGIPKDIAWTSYSPYIMRRLRRAGLSGSKALELIESRDKIAERALIEEMNERPVIYSRAPAWHRFSKLAGKPKLIDGNAIAINSAVTVGLNADFDGDTVNIHVPALDETVKEAKEKLMPSKMLFSIRDPDKVMPVVKHEQLLGLYSSNLSAPSKKVRLRSPAELEKAIDSGLVEFSDEVEFETN
jgi:DNA-directed RNA polymerase subunit beta'